jgi:hypothetical protein
VFESEHQLPPSRQIGSEFFPYVILADGSFGSKNYMVTPYEQAQVKDRKKLRFNERLFG